LVGWAVEGAKKLVEIAEWFFMVHYFNINGCRVKYFRTIYEGLDAAVTGSNIPFAENLYRVLLNCS
jgi:hypothetical protein